MIEGMTFSVFWRLMTWLPAFILRRFFSKQTLAERTRIDVRPRNNPVQIRGGEIPEATIWLQISNKGYFPIELDRLTVELWLAGVTAQFYSLDRVIIEAGAEQEVYLRGPLAIGHIKHLAHNRNNSNTSISVRAEFNSKIHNFSVITGQLSGINPDLSSI